VPLCAIGSKTPMPVLRIGSQTPVPRVLAVQGAPLGGAAARWRRDPTVGSGVEALERALVKGRLSSGSGSVAVVATVASGLDLYIVCQNMWKNVAAVCIQWGLLGQLVELGN
jgi:hypothetical protein